MLYLRLLIYLGIILVLLIEVYPFSVGVVALSAGVLLILAVVDILHAYDKFRRRDGRGGD